jgi:hypothetical protein
MSITTLLQQQLVDGVGSVTIGAITQDESGDAWNGQYTRTITVYGPAPQSGSTPVLFTLVLYATTEAAIELAAPSQNF